MNNLIPEKWYIAEYPRGNILFQFHSYKDNNYIKAIKWRTISGYNFSVTGIHTYGIATSVNIRIPTDEEMKKTLIFK